MIKHADIIQPDRQLSRTLERVTVELASIKSSGEISQYKLGELIQLVVTSHEYAVNLENLRAEHLRLVIDASLIATGTRGSA